MIVLVVREQYVVGVDLGGTKIYTALAAKDGSVLAELKVPTGAAGGPGHVIARIAETVRQVEQEAGIPAGRVCLLALGAPGPLDTAQGVVLFSPNLKWRDVPVARLLGQETGIPVRLENDANVAALGEHVFGAGRGERNLIYITVSTGIGGGLILEDRLYRGSTDSAGEIGHMTVLPGGPVCGCGNRGCLEAVASGTAMARRAVELVESGGGTALLALAGGDPDAINAETVSAAAAAGDLAATNIIAEVASFLGIGVASLINLLNPSLVILGGGVMAIGEPVWREVRREVQARSLEAPRKRVRLVPAALGDRSGVLGAVALALQATGRKSNNT